MNAKKAYIAIDLKSFYASVECKERGLNPLTTNLVVADSSRTEKTICLAVSPTLKAYGVPSRPRLFEVIQRVAMVNALRKYNAPKSCFKGKSYDDNELKSNPALEIDYITAPPRMALYLEYSAKIYGIYLKYIAPEDIHSYSIDEVFIDATHYLEAYKMTAAELAEKIISDVLCTTGITATAGIGTNLYLCKVAMDIVAKHITPDKNGVRIAELDEMSYRKTLWNHTPLTDFWRVGRGYAKKLEEKQLYTMGDIARCSVGKPNQYYNEELLYKLFGVNAELLIDHAWGYEPATIKQIKAYKPENSCLSSGQVLQCPYEFSKARLVIKEMAELMSLDLVDKGLLTDQLVLTVNYDVKNLNDSEIRQKYSGEIATDYYGRKAPKQAHGTINLKEKTASTRLITNAAVELFDKIVNKDLLVRKLNITANKVVPESTLLAVEQFEQLDLFSDAQSQIKQREKEKLSLAKEKQMQKAVLSIKKKYGKNAILRGMNLTDGATAKERNRQIGGHKA